MADLGNKKNDKIGECDFWNKGEKYKSKRIHIYVSDEINEFIRNECERQGTTISKYIVNKVIEFDASNIMKRLNEIIKMLKILKKKKVLNVLSNKEMDKLLEGTAGETIEEVLKEADSKPFTNKSKGLHLRMDAKTYDALKAKADKMSMSMSDYVGFVCTEFDIENISKKVDAIYDLLLKAVEKADES